MQINGVVSCMCYGKMLTLRIIKSYKFMFDKKSFIYVLLSTLLVVGAVVWKHNSDQNQNTQIAFTPGTYEGSATGYHGDVRLAVTFDENSITQIEVLEEQETEDIGHKAIPILTERILEAQGAGVDVVTGATVTSNAVINALCKAAKEAGVSDMKAFRNKRAAAKQKGEDIEDEWDIVVIGGGGAGLAAAAQAAQDGNTVLVMEKNADLGGNTVISGGVYQSVNPYLVWDMQHPDDQEGKGYDGKMHPKVMAVGGNQETLKMILNWSEKPFDKAYYATHPFVAGDEVELSKHGVHPEYLPVLRALKDEIRAYLAWAEKRMKQGATEEQLPLFSTNNLHIFQTYYGGLRMSNDGKDWCYGDVELVKQFVNEGQALRPWLESMGVDFTETQGIIVGALWYRANKMNGAKVTIDGKTEYYERNKGIYVMAPYAAIVNANKKNQVLTLTSAQDLIVKNGRVVGVNALREDGSKVVAHARKGVIVATGGYAANVKMVVETNRYWSSKDLLPSTKTTNRSSLTGDGIIMAQHIGADVVGMGWTQLLPLSFAKSGNIAFGGVDNSVCVSPKDGKRYVDELSERDVLSLAAFQHGVKFDGANGVHYYISGVHSNSEKYGPILPDNEGEQYTIKPAQLSGLLKTLGLDTDAEAILNTIREFDKAIMDGRQPKGVSRRYAVATIGYCEKRPDGTYDKSTYDFENTDMVFRILAPATHHTMGGLRIDTSRRVLDVNGKPIPGLFAAGEVTGGIHGGNRLGGNALTEILVSGRIAARTASGEK